MTFVPRTLFTAVAVGLNGSDVSYDAGHHWTTFDAASYDTVSCAQDGSCWASGDLGPRGPAARPVVAHPRSRPGPFG